MKKSLVTGAILAALSAGVSANGVDASPEQSLNSLMTEVSNQCIVMMKGTLSKQDIGKKASQLSANGVGIKHAYSAGFNGMTVKMNCMAAKKAFSGDDSVTKFIPDGVVSIAKGKPGGGGGGSSQVTPWGVSRVGGPVDGTGRTAWVIDTGIDLDHPDLNVDDTNGFSAWTSGRNAGMDDKNGHGTHVAGSIAALDNSTGVVGVAAGAKVVPIKVLDSRGSGSWSGVLAGVDHVANNASPGDCVNMSLGGGFSQDLNDAVIAAAQSSGAMWAIAAGNDGDHANNHSPASANHARIYTISATDVNDNMPSWSNYGNPPVDYAAPGVSILSTAKGGGTTTMSGTSMAAPHACAILMMGNPRTSGTAGNDPDGNPDPIMSL
jgi:subtilisin family serine protease